MAEDVVPMAGTSTMVDDFNQNFHPNIRGDAVSKTAFIFEK